MNSTIIDCFQKLIHKTSHDLKSSNSMTLKFKLASYRKTMALLKSLKFDITSTDQIKDIKGFGKTTIEKINEILKTGNLKQIASLNETILTKSEDLADLQKTLRPQARSLYYTRKVEYINLLAEKEKKELSNIKNILKATKAKTDKDPEEKLIDIMNKYDIKHPLRGEE